MPSLFYIRLISFTAGTLVYLFLLALILGHRRPRFFERILFFLILSLFLIYAGGLLKINAQIAYGSPPEVTLRFAEMLETVGVLLVFPLTAHAHFKYREQVRGETIAWNWVTWLPYLAVVGYVGTKALSGGGLLDVLRFDLQNALIALELATFATATLDSRIARTARGEVERKFFLGMEATSWILFAIFLTMTTTFVQGIPKASEALETAGLLLGIVPGALLLYYAVRRNFLEYGAQRNLMYALPVTFLALLYLALVRRVSGWLEPVVPPEATAAVLLFSLIFLFEPLERVIGPALHRRFQEGLGGVQRLSVELQQVARQGNVARLVTEAEKRIREAFGLADVRV